MRLYGLIGYPLAQSFSKKYFDAKFIREGLTDCRFENFPIPSIDQLPGMLSDHPDLLGFAVTIPYKQQVLSYLDSDENIPSKLGACNCVKISNGLLEGFNTDYIGFEKSFVPLLRSNHRKALILGHGGAARAVMYVIEQLGMEYKIVSRKIHDGSHLSYRDIDKKIMDDYHVIINTTPLGMFPNNDTCPDIPYQFLTDKHLLYDVVYNPGLTLFLEKGKERGAAIKNGEEMLVLQAEENWGIWNKR